MIRFGRYLAGGIGVILLAFVLALAPSGPVTAGSPKPVEVVNTPQVQAQQSGRWTLDFSHPIQVASSDANPVLVRDVDNAARIHIARVLRDQFHRVRRHV